MSVFRFLLSSTLLMVFSFSAIAQEDMDALDAAGKELYFAQVSCWVCHGDNAEGRIGPTLHGGPSPLEIQEQLDSNPQMGIIVSELNPDVDDLVALSVFIGGLGGNTYNSDELAVWREELETMLAARGEEAVYPVSARDQLVLNIQSFDTVVADWSRKANSGPLKREYEVQVLAEYEPSEQVFFPEPGGLYFYENTGTGGAHAPDPSMRTDGTAVVVGDATSMEVITSGQMPRDLRGQVHTTALSPDGKYVYMIGPSGVREGWNGSPLRTPATLLKVDALTLQPVKQLSIGGRLHHAQLFQDKYILMDTFISDPDGLNVFLYDPETDEIVGGVNTRDLGGSNYTAYTDNEFIYILMQPGADGGSLTGAGLVAGGEYTALRPYWVAKLDPETWEVLDEYPYRGYRGDWVTIDADSEYMYVPSAGSSNVTKLSIETGEIMWSHPSGIGPYGSNLNADQTELWVADKGEGTGHIGRTITVLDAESGRSLDTLFSGFAVDHVLLSPNGKEMWATSNGEGRIFVFDAETREELKVIDMPGYGQPHGLVWVYYDENGESRVVRDQGGFAGGIDPTDGRPLVLD